MLTTADIAKIIRSLCYVHIQSVEGKTLPTENIADVHVGGIDVAAEEIARRCSPDSGWQKAIDACVQITRDYQDDAMRQQQEADQKNHVILQRPALVAAVIEVHIRALTSGSGPEGGR